MVLNLYLLLNRGEMLLPKVSTELTKWFAPKGIGKTLEIVGHKIISTLQHDSVDITKPSEKNLHPVKKVSWILVWQLLYSSFDNNNLALFYLWWMKIGCNSSTNITSKKFFFIKLILLNLLNFLRDHLFPTAYSKFILLLFLLCNFLNFFWFYYYHVLAYLLFTPIETSV